MKLEELNFKCILDTVEKRKALQEALFAVGGKWASCEKHVLNLDEPLLMFNIDGLAYHQNAYRYKKECLPELTYAEAMAEIAKVEVEPKSKRVDFDIEDEGFSIKPLFHGTNMDYFLDEIYQAINEHKHIKAFGGIQYIEPVSGEKSQFSGSPFVGYKMGFRDTNNLCQNLLPVYPHKIRFWVEA